MIKKELNVFKSARSILIEDTRKAFKKYCDENEVIGIIHDLKIKDLWLTNYEMVKHPTCLFTGEIVVTQKKLMEILGNLEEYESMDLRITQHTNVMKKRLYTVETDFCFDYVTEEIRFAPEW